ncbi:hypothetical protein HD596_007997 [Nonomuraea jabiensis]|uniref:Tetracyclin repressor-like C-terminal domain-containing protein n=1 Tax=Nonomuraea jabiensis TaxID=882448 RepID=A0A7W9LEU7_9ACTN|nr:hypothetical protein [Nonomuraea jabiensis]
MYRRWGDVGGLLADVLDAAGEEDWQPPDTGSLTGDLAALNHEIQASLTAHPPIVTALIAASFRSEKADRAQQRLREDRYAQCEIIVSRAIRRGELRPHIDARRLLVSATAPVYHRLLLLRTAPDPRLPEHAARTAALAASAGAFTEGLSDGTLAEPPSDSAFTESPSDGAFAKRPSDGTFAGPPSDSAFAKPPSHGAFGESTWAGDT